MLILFSNECIDKRVFEVINESVSLDALLMLTTLSCFCCWFFQQTPPPPPWFNVESKQWCNTKFLFIYFFFFSCFLCLGKLSCRTKIKWIWWMNEYKINMDRCAPNLNLDWFRLCFLFHFSFICATTLMRRYLS